MATSAKSHVSGDENRQGDSSSSSSSNSAVVEVGSFGLNENSPAHGTRSSSKSSNRSGTRSRSRSRSRSKGGSGSGSGSDSGGDPAFQYNTLPSDCSDDDHDVGDADGTQYGGYMALPVAHSVSGSGSSDEGEGQDATGIDVEDGGSSAQSQLQLRLADAQLLSLERDYQRTISMNGACSRGASFELDASQGSFLYDDDFDEPEPEDCERAECDAANHSPAANKNIDRSRNIRTTKSRKKRKKKARKKQTKSKGPAKFSGQAAAPTDGGAAVSAAQRRRAQLLEAAQLEIIVEHINAAEGVSNGSEHVGRTGAGRHSKRDLQSSDAPVSGRRANGPGRASRQLGLAPAESIRGAMQGFQLSAAPSWAQSGDISRVIAEFCKIQVGRETTSARAQETAATGSASLDTRKGSIVAHDGTSIPNPAVPAHLIDNK